MTSAAGRSLLKPYYARRCLLIRLCLLCVEWKQKKNEKISLVPSLFLSAVMTFHGDANYSIISTVQFCV